MPKPFQEDHPMLSALLQTAAALTVLNVAPPPVRQSALAWAATARGFEAAWMIQPDLARRFLTLQHRSPLTESLGCMITKSLAGPCSLQRGGPASVPPSPSARGRVVSEQMDDDASGRGSS